MWPTKVFNLARNWIPKVVRIEDKIWCSSNYNNNKKQKKLRPKLLCKELNVHSDF